MFSVSFQKDENKEKEAGNGPFKKYFKQWWMIASWEKVRAHFRRAY